MISNYAALDRPEILRFLFYPRKEWEQQGPSRLFAQDLMIPVENDTVVGARFHLAGPEAPNILYFHGNGEIVADYDDLAEIYNDHGLNFLPVDYRGYGRSSGTPTVTSMLGDAGVIFEFVVRYLERKQYTGPMIVMGRSL
ncbi:MAG: alpha/beta hydrolase, partial [Desulfobacterales bacterium]|nr:alpha/beta hydrolase [Desulfobacterales bacterium]